MIVVTCPEIACRFNGFGECQLGLVAQAVLNGTEVSRDACPYFESYAPPAAPDSPGRHPSA